MTLRLVPIVLLVAACGLAGPGASPTLAPTNPPTAAPTPAPTQAPTAAPTDAQPTDVSELPPDALLAANGDPVAGYLGTFCWRDTCADAPEIPPKDQLPTLDASAGSELTLALADETGFVGWRAVYAAGSNSDETTELGSGGDPDSGDPSASPMTSANFPAPPQGDWAIHVFVRFADGDASYAWHVSVP